MADCSLTGQKQVRMLACMLSARSLSVLDPRKWTGRISARTVFSDPLQARAHAKRQLRRTRNWRTWYQILRRRVCFAAKRQDIKWRARPAMSQDALSTGNPLNKRPKTSTSSERRIVEHHLAQRIRLHRRTKSNPPEH